MISRFFDRELLLLLLLLLEELDEELDEELCRLLLVLLRLSSGDFPGSPGFAPP